MFSDSTEYSAETYKDIYLQLKSELKWKVSDPRSLMMISALYAVNNTTFDMEKLHSLSSFIKKSVGVFSPLKTYVRYNLAAMLLVRHDDAEAKFIELNEIYDKMITRGFSRGTFTYFSAFSVLTGRDETKKEEDLMEKSILLYKAMRKKHYFLTSASDYPLSVLIAQNDASIEYLIARMEYFYSSLSDGLFSKSDQLQFLSHILTLDQTSGDKALIEKCQQLYQLLKDKGIKPKPKIYPVIGLLSILEEPAEELDSVVKLTELLNSKKVFKWYKEENFMFAVHLTVSKKLQHTHVSEIGISTAIETIIQAQQAAMTAAVVGASAAAASAGAGN
ncbi:DUF4003 family protein [Peribacillus deserti]|uniref:DUF4003 domain-containing protein n=1 Tax=Peribacillus deserti TaxID=673318 RepID=A0A2N5M0W0_9BACI|nr:DUF4003 family protein [Peribacillus deserti]PLT27992.1 hypothetical protein CUU66_20885 [Peribacillus deserti]